MLQEEFESILLDPACVAWLSVRGTQIRYHKKPTAEFVWWEWTKCVGLFLEVVGCFWLFWGMFCLYCLFFLLWFGSFFCTERLAACLFCVFFWGQFLNMTQFFKIPHATQSSNKWHVFPSKWWRVGRQLHPWKRKTLVETWISGFIPSYTHLQPSWFFIGFAGIITTL